MGFFGVRVLLCYYGGAAAYGWRRAHRDGVARDVREDPGDSDTHLFADRGHLGKRSAAGSGSGRSLGDHRDDAPENGSKKLDDRHFYVSCFFVPAKGLRGWLRAALRPGGGPRPVESVSTRGGFVDRGRLLRRAHVRVSKPASQGRV